MDHAQLISLVLLVLILVLAIWRRLNIGLLGLGAAAVLMAVSGLSAKQIFTHFPGSVFTLLVGVSLLFSHLERSGGLLWFANKVYGAIGERTSLIPWAGFVLGALISTAGAFSPAPISLLVPIIAALSQRFPKLFFISEMAVIIGANVAGLSPLNPTGIVIRNAAEHANVHYNPWEVWAVGMVVAVMTVWILQMMFRSKNMYESDPKHGNKKVDPNLPGRFLLIRPAGANTDDAPILQPFYATISSLAILAFVCLVVLVGADVGLSAISLAVLLMIFFPKHNGQLLQRVPWNAVVVLCGLLTYVSSMQDIGTMDAIQKLLMGITSDQLLLVFIIAYLTALLSNIESSTLGVLSLVMPMLFSVAGNAADLSIIIAAVVAPASLSVVNPIHAAGTLTIAYTDGKQQNALFRRLLIISGFFVVIAPGLLTILPVILQ